jgi:hypothetical protein
VLYYGDAGLSTGDNLDALSPLVRVPCNAAGLKSKAWSERRLFVGKENLFDSAVKKFCGS